MAGRGSVNSFVPRVGVHRISGYDLQFEDVLRAEGSFHSDILAAYNVIPEHERADFKHNGAVTSVIGLNIDGGIVRGKVNRTNYFFRNAMERVAELDTEPQEMARYSPNILNTSLWSVIKDEDDGGRYKLVCHLRGVGALGQGQIFTGIAAGHVDANHLASRNPIEESFREEVGEDLTSGFLEEYSGSLTGFRYLVSEGKTGAVNLVKLLRLGDKSKLISYMEKGHRLLVEQDDGSPEIGGVVLIPLEDISNYPDCQVLDFQGQSSPQGRVENLLAFRLRPYSQKVLQFLRKDEAARKELLELSGF
ncbi:hypothetical protein HOC01_06320 [archaeon]|nr:hypothetical protein [archaeon]MBT6697543.1 hypothetical protein [archaeon]